MTQLALRTSPVAALFGRRPRAPRPVLLGIVFGLFLVILGITATAQTVLVSLHVSTASLNATLGSDAATVRTFVNGLVRPGDLTAGAAAGRITLVEEGLRSIAERGEILQIEIRDPDGVVRLASEPSARGIEAAPTEAFKRALSGTVDAALVTTGTDTEALGPAVTATPLIREYFPLLGTDGVVHAVVAIWRDAGPTMAAIDRIRRDVVLVTFSGATIAAALLFLVFRTAQRRITLQTQALTDSATRDPLTGLLNHGSLVEEVAGALEEARATGGAMAIALLDLDNFKLVNETYGHDSGDAVLQQLARNIETMLPAGSMAGRYGPDEFLVVNRSGDLAALEALVTGLRRLLAGQAMAIKTSERLPITVSAGIAGYPVHAASATELLTLVALALAEAKLSGGDGIRFAREGGESSVEAAGEARSFDVLQGLVFAIDTKDRYTKRHSEDVARYGVFLARLAGLDPGDIEGIRAAGLLHDVGKIGLPDDVLRKPGRLTARESEIVQQHVALGDSIVRNIANVDLIRAGIRHHHERWDGRGYLHALAGEDIPLVARILAVADAFSAMTTTRPYRKALSVEEALRRLGDAAGTQLDERLAAMFIHGLEAMADAPLPGEDHLSTPLWVPQTGSA